MRVEPSWASLAFTMLEEGQQAGLVTVMATQGSAPREAGARMVVSDVLSFGSIGGGHLEHIAQQQARRLLIAPGPSWRIQDFPLGPLLGQCCGGKVRLLIERLHRDNDGTWLAAVESRLRSLKDFSIRYHFGPDRIVRAVEDMGPGRNWGSFPDRNSLAHDFVIEPVGAQSQRVIMVGAGHVGSAIARAIRYLPFQTIWYDTRPEFADEHVICRPARSIEQYLWKTEANDRVLVLTHDHALDFRMIEAGLRGQASFVGLIGSNSKRARFVSRLEKAGYGLDVLSRLVCPIGLPGITGKEPAVIAASVAAQLLTIKDSIEIADQTIAYANSAISRIRR